MLSSQKQAALEWIETHKNEVAKLSDLIWSYAEPALREYKSSKEHAAFLQKYGFEVDLGIAGLPTAYLATYGSGKPVIGFFTEYDATPGNSQNPVISQKRWNILALYK